MMGRALLLLLLVLLVCLPVLAAEGEGGNSSELIFKWINFLVVFGGGAYFARTPLKRKFAEIRQGIRTEIDQARQQRESSQQRLRGIEQRLAGLEQETEQMRRDAETDAAAQLERIRETAQREADRILSTSKAEIESAGRAARLELRAYAARLAVSLAEERIRRQLSPKAHATLFQAFIKDFSTPSTAQSGAERRH